MSTKAAVLYQFLSSFGLSAYSESFVPDEADYPYLTYNFVSGGFEEGESNITVNLWYYGESEAIPNAKAEEIGERLGRGGIVLACDNGGMWIKRGSPFAQAVVEENPMIKRRYINIDIEYLTDY